MNNHENFFAADQVLIILRTLGFTQSNLAEKLGITPSGISKYLQYNSGLRKENLLKLQNILHDCIELALEYFRLKRKHGSIDEIVQLERRIEDELGRRAARKIRFLSLEDVDRLKDLNSRVGLSTRQSTVLSSPGGGLPVNAENYVKRTADKNIKGILDDDIAPATIVMAPIQGGTSSFLNRVREDASKKTGTFVKFIHMDTYLQDDCRYTELYFFKHMFGEIGLPIEELNKKEITPEELRAKFELWARKNLMDYDKIILIIDGLDQVFKTARSKSDAYSIVDWMSAMRNLSAMGKPPFNKFVLFAALSGRTWSAAYASPFVTQALALKLPKLTKAEVVGIFENHDQALTPEEIKKIMNMFHGHPFLVSLFAWSMYYEGYNFSSAFDCAVNLDGKYLSHWERVKSELLYLFNYQESLEGILRGLIDMSQPASSTESIYSSLNFMEACADNLRALGVIDGQKGDYRVCDFYLYAAQRDLKDLSSGK